MYTRYIIGGTPCIWAKNASQCKRGVGSSAGVGGYATVQERGRLQYSIDFTPRCRVDAQVQEVSHNAQHTPLSPQINAQHSVSSKKASATNQFGLLSCTSLLSNDPGALSHTRRNAGIDTWYIAGRFGSSEVPRNPLTRWDVSSIPANGIFLTKKQKNKNKNAQRVEND